MSLERKRLALKRETIRYLGDDELMGVYGGGTIGAGSTNIKTEILGTAFRNKGPDDEDARPPRVPPGFIAPTLPGPRPTPRPQPQPQPQPLTRPVITGASYYCG